VPVVDSRTLYYTAVSKRADLLKPVPKRFQNSIGILTKLWRCLGRPDHLSINLETNRRQASIWR
jgi:hypothetical protein